MCFPAQRIFGNLLARFPVPGWSRDAGTPGSLLSTRNQEAPGHLPEHGAPRYLLRSKQQLSPSIINQSN